MRDDQSFTLRSLDLTERDRLSNPSAEEKIDKKHNNDGMGDKRNTAGSVNLNELQRSTSKSLASSGRVKSERSVWFSDDYLNKASYPSDSALGEAPLTSTSLREESDVGPDIPAPSSKYPVEPKKSRFLLDIDTDLDSKPDLLVTDERPALRLGETSSFVDIPTLPFNASQGRFKQKEFLSVATSPMEGGNKKVSANTQKSTYRFLDRNAPFAQSYGHTNFFKGTNRNTRAAVEKLYVSDWFHTFLNLRFREQAIVLFVCMILTWVFFAALFFAIQDSASLEMDSFLDAFYLTLSTMETIGYGAGDVTPENPSPWYFNQCVFGAIVLSVEVFLSLIFYIFSTGILSSRIGKPQARASTVVFSSKALVQFNIQGAPHLVFRVADLRRHQLIEGHIRCYCIRYNKEGDAATNQQYSGMQVYPMRLDQPNDTQNAMLVLSMPQEVIHRIDAWSPLSPYFKPLELLPTKPIHAESSVEPSLRNVSGGIPQRMTDCDVGIRYCFACEVCGQEFTSIDALHLHVKVERRALKEKQPRRNRHGTYCPRTLVEPSAAELQAYWEQDGQNFEVICICEGIEPFTSSSLQARHSYTSTHDISFDRRMTDCIYSTNGRNVFDLSLFHRTVRRNRAKPEPNITPPSSNPRSPTYLSSLSPSNVLAAIDDRVREGLFAAMSENMSGDFIQTPSGDHRLRLDSLNGAPVYDHEFWQSLPREHFPRI